MGFSLNSLEAEELKRALQRDSSVSEITLNQNHAFNLTNCSRVLEYYKSETAFNIKFGAIVYFLELVKQSGSLIWLVWQSSTTSGSTPDMRTEGREDGWRDARQRTGGDGGSG